MNKLYHISFWEKISKTSCLFSKVPGLESIFLKTADLTTEVFPHGFYRIAARFWKRMEKNLRKECYSTGYSAKTGFMKQGFLEISEIFLTLIAVTAEGSWRAHLLPRFCQS